MLLTATQPSARLRLVRLIWPFIAIVLLLLVLGTTSLQVIRGLRAYITAESTWSNAQNAAVEALEQYAQTRNEDHFDRYIEEARVVAGARMARIELEKPFPDFDIARAGLLHARNRSGRHRRHDRAVPPLSSGRLHGRRRADLD